MEGSKVGKEPIGQELLKRYANLADKAKELAERVQTKLIPIMNNAPTVAEDEGKDMLEYPPLFSELREYYKTIKNALNDIDACLSRVEI